MSSPYLWQYFLVVPATAAAAANAVATSLGNPSPIEESFRQYPLPAESGEYLEPATHWVATFLATDTNADGNPSREALEGYLGQNPTLTALLWVRCKNPYHPDTLESDRNIVVASNWPAFPPGAISDWAAVAAALAP